MVFKMFLTIIGTCKIIISSKYLWNRITTKMQIVMRATVPGSQRSGTLINDVDIAPSISI